MRPPNLVDVAVKISDTEDVLIAVKSRWVAPICVITAVDTRVYRGPNGPV